MADEWEKEVKMIYMLKSCEILWLYEKINKNLIKYNRVRSLVHQK